MVVRILIGFAAVTILILFAVWLATGGAQEIARIARGITNPFGFIFTGELSNFRLPWQPETQIRGPIVDGEGAAFDTESEPAGEGGLEALERDYDALAKDARDAKNFGAPSPYRGQVVLSAGAAAETGGEYLELHTGWDNTAPVKVSGWSVQSALTGVRAYIPRGAHPFMLGSVNMQSDIYLEQGGVAILASAASPVGTSFRENACTGYLASAQAFIPPLERICPLPSEELPLTQENIRTYGEDCFDFVQTLSQCTFPASIPASIPSACHLFLANNLSYNGCVQNHRHESDFAHDSWRIYLNAGGELWRNTHDIIRLLDEQGRTVDMVSY